MRQSPSMTLPNSPDANLVGKLRSKTSRLSRCTIKLCYIRHHNHFNWCWFRSLYLNKKKHAYHIRTYHVFMNAMLNKCVPRYNMLSWRKYDMSVCFTNNLCIILPWYSGLVEVMKSLGRNSGSHNWAFDFQWPLLLTWFNFNPSMDK